MTTFAERLIERMSVWNTGPVVDGATDLERLCKAIGAMFEPVEELAAEVGSDGEPGYQPPYARLLDVQLAKLPELRYLAMYVGVSIPGGATEAEARQLVQEHAGFDRGTLATVEGAVKRIAGEPFSVVERTGPLGEPDPYYFLVFVGVGKKTNALYEAINAVKPAGLFYTVSEAENEWINGVKAHWSEVTVAHWTEMIEPEY